MKKTTAIIIMAIMAITGCELHDSGTFEPYEVGGLTVTSPNDGFFERWDAVLNRDNTIRDDEKLASAQEVYGIVKVRFVSEPEPPGEDVWIERKLHDITGDCDDFAETCRGLLLSQYWRPNDVVLLGSGTHLVCGVIIYGEIYILDNLGLYVTITSDTDYKWTSIFHNGRWYYVE